VQIIRRLREFTKAKPVELEQLDLNRVVRDSAELIAYEIRRVAVTLRLELDEGLPPVMGDRIQLEQLLVNLMVNACQAMESTPQGERILRVGTYKCGPRVCIAVRDAGVGIADAEVHRLFEPFYTTKKEGMGMGLALAKSIAEAHGIDLSFQKNEDDRGMTFLLSIPTTGTRAP
jgi:C4-dicarboxylate-specific signal transduction histidine kinase